MYRKIVHIIGCIMLVVLAGCEKQPTPAPIPTQPPGQEESGQPAQLTGILSSSNTSIELYFSGPLSDGARGTAERVGCPTGDASIHKTMMVRNESSFLIMAVASDLEKGTCEVLCLRSIIQPAGNLGSSLP